MTTLGFDPLAEAHRHWIDHGWGDAADGMMAVTAVMRAQQVLLQRIDAVLRPLDLTFARYEVLMLLSFTKEGQLPMSKLGARLQVHPASVTSAVDRLERDGYVSRERGERDRRLVLARITPAGRRRALAATAVLNREVFLEVGASRSAATRLTTELDRMRVHLGDTPGD